MVSVTSSTTRSRRSALAGLLLAGSLTALSACGTSDSDSVTTAGSETTTAAVTELTLAGAWARTSPATSTVGAAYVTITSPIADALIGVMVDASVAADGAEMHEMVMSDGSSMTDTSMTGDSMSMGSETTAGGMGEMTMQPVSRIELPAGKAVALAPGGYHIMLLGLVRPLELGTTIQLTFVFEQAGSVTIDVPELDEAPMP